MGKKEGRENDGRGGEGKWRDLLIRGGGEGRGGEKGEGGSPGYYGSPPDLGVLE